MNQNKNDFFHTYFHTMVEYLYLLYPQYNKEQIKDVVKDIVKDLHPDMNITYVYHKSPGNSEIKTSNICEFLKLCENKILTPSGSIYQTSLDQSSFFVDLIKTNTKDRSNAKKKKLEAKALGNRLEVDYWENQQQQKKYDNNGFSGLLRNAFVGFYDIAGYNSTTSIARKSIYLSYAFTERFLAGNFFLPTFESIINHCLLIKQYSKPLPFLPLIDRLYIPSKEDVYQFLIQCYSKYYHAENIIQDNLFKIKRLLDTFNEQELTCLFYYSNLYNFIQYNENWLKPYLQDILKLEVINNTNISESDIIKLDEDLMIVLSVIAHQHLDGNFLLQNKHISVQDDITKQSIIHTGYKLQNKIENELLPLIYFFCDFPIEIPDIQSSKKMIRQVVVSSDTDSVLYTKDPYVKWYTGSSSISLDSMNISALLDYLLTKCIKKPLEIHCLNHNVNPNDISMISMKNEYTYTIFIASNKPKTYIGGLLIQEGRVFKNLELDIKGSTYKGSIYSSSTLSEYKKFLYKTIDEITSQGSLSAVQYIQYLVEREQHIIQKLKDGNVQYLVPKSIRTKNDYKDVEKSILFNLNIWNNIFGSKYGILTPPLKTLCVDIDSDLIKSQSYHEWLESYDNIIYQKFIKVLENINPKKSITFLPINPVSEAIPKELIPIVNYRSIAHKNCKPWYELYQSFSITIPPITSEYLFSDIYM
jgi:hypothetical protein